MAWHGLLADAGVVARLIFLQEAVFQGCKKEGVVVLIMALLGVVLQEGM